MTQTYRNPAALAWMREGKCPECGELADDHSGVPQFWLRGGGCDLLPRGVADRINHQAHLDEAAGR